MTNSCPKLKKPINYLISLPEHSNVLAFAYEIQQFRKECYAIVENCQLQGPYALEIDLKKKTCML